MKLKYNHNGETNEIPLSTDTPQGKRLAVRHDNQTYYAPLVPTTDSAASDIHLVFGGEIFAVQSQPPPKVTAVNVAPSSVAVMQGQSATATVSAVGNEYISGLSYGLSGAPTWITISDDLILIQPSDNDLGIANVQVYAQDTGSDAMSAAILRAEAKLRPIIESLSVIPPAVTVQQGQSAIATVSAVANEAVTGLSYSLNGASSWVNLNGDYIYVTPTDNDLGSNTVDVIAYDTNSSASASAQFVATAELRPIIESVSVNPPTVAAIQGESATATISAVVNEAVTGLSYSLDGQPSWMNLSGSVILMTPTENDSGSAAVTVTARDTGSSASAVTVFDAEAIELPEITYFAVPNFELRPFQSEYAAMTISANIPISEINFTSSLQQNYNTNVQCSYGRTTLYAISRYDGEKQFTYTITAIHKPTGLKLGEASGTFTTLPKIQTSLTANPTIWTVKSANSSSVQTLKSAITLKPGGYKDAAGNKIPIKVSGEFPRDATLSLIAGTTTDEYRTATLQCVYNKMYQGPTGATRDGHVTITANAVNWIAQSTAIITVKGNMCLESQTISLA